MTVFTVLVDDLGNEVHATITLLELEGVTWARWLEQDPSGVLGEHLLQLKHVRRLARPADTQPAENGHVPHLQEVPR